MKKEVIAICIIIVVAIIASVILLYPKPPISIDDLKKEAKSTFKLYSPAFEYGGSIPVKYTCKGDDTSIPLSWEGYPDNTKSFLIIMYDPDAPSGTFIHWIVYNIPPNVNSLPEGIAKESRIEGLCCQGVNDFGRIGYDGPCPPPGPKHRYFIIIFALDSMLDISGSVKLNDVLSAAKGHVLAYAEYMGKFGLPTM